jgi:hypothetical protein
MISESESLPYAETFVFYRPPEDWRCVLEFRLIYTGPLSANPDASDKHALRKFFHRQLAELWHKHPLLKQRAEVPGLYYKTPSSMVSYPGPGVPQFHAVSGSNAKPYVEYLADNYPLGDYRFAPLVQEKHAVCSLDILFLRHEAPGHIVKRNGGDIDGRMVTLFDGLRRADKMEELGKFIKPDPDENPFYCLLEDDRSITELHVTTDRLLLPAKPGHEINNVHLIIHVKTQSINPEALFGDVHMLQLDL